MKHSIYTPPSLLLTYSYRLCIRLSLDQPHRPPVSFKPQLTLKVSIQRALEHPTVAGRRRRISQLPLGEELSKVLADASLRELDDLQDLVGELLPPRCLVSCSHGPQVPVSALVGLPLAVLEAMLLCRTGSLRPRLIEAVRGCERIRKRMIMVSDFLGDGS